MNGTAARPSDQPRLAQQLGRALVVGLCVATTACPGMITDLDQPLQHVRSAGDASATATAEPASEARSVQPELDAGAPAPTTPDASNVARPTTCPIPGGRLVAVGDSITKGTHDGEPNYPLILSELLGRPVENLGHGGAVATNPNTVDTRFPSLADLPGRPGTALLRIGFNDLRLLRLSSDLVIEAIDAYVARQVANGWHVLVLPIWRSNDGVSMDLARMRVNAHLARRYGAPTITEDAVMGDRSDPGDKTCLFDGVHPTERCHRHQAEYAVRALLACP